MKEGERGGGAYLIQQGQVGVFVTRQGQQQKLAELGANQIVGEMALIDSLPRSASVTALQDTVVIPIDLSRLRGIMKVQPDLALSIVRVLVRKIRDTNELVFKEDEGSPLDFWYRVVSLTEMWGAWMMSLPENSDEGIPLPEALSRGMGIPVGEAFKLTNTLKEVHMVEASAKCLGMEPNRHLISIFMRTYEKERKGGGKKLDVEAIRALVCRAIINLLHSSESTKAVEELGERRAVDFAELQRNLLDYPFLGELNPQERDTYIRSSLMRLQRDGLLEREPADNPEVIINIHGLNIKAETAEEVPPEYEVLRAVFQKS